ncbi:MAG: biotin synthase BioB [Chlamydiae bacterium]|nr:biotin synthase BioB [Chlamydiota bacterium]
MIKHDWTLEELKIIHDAPLLDLIYKAAHVHRQYHPPSELQICSLISIKTGGCPEDCKYCPQSARYQTNVEIQGLMDKEAVIEQALEAKKQGSSRVCLGAAWRQVRDSRQFELVLDMVKEISAMNIEVCCCLGMLNEEQALRLKQAGLHSYNHNLDTSRAYYPSIITTRTYDDRLETLNNAEKAGINLCCGGIIGMGESVDDRISMLHTLATRSSHPSSVPINMLVPIKGTPLGEQKPVSIWEMIRMIATARIAMPEAMVRLSAGRLERSLEEHALCFLAGANSIFSGEKLLTTPNPGVNFDEQMIKLFGMSRKGEMACV